MLEASGQKAARAGWEVLHGHHGYEEMGTMGLRDTKVRSKA